MFGYSCCCQHLNVQATTKLRNQETSSMLFKTRQHLFPQSALYSAYIRVVGVRKTTATTCINILRTAAVLLIFINIYVSVCVNISAFMHVCVSLRARISLNGNDNATCCYCKFVLVTPVDAHYCLKY